VREVFHADRQTGKLTVRHDEANTFRFLRGGGDAPRIGSYLLLLHVEDAVNLGSVILGTVRSCVSITHRSVISKSWETLVCII
jgi:hypothetical protein